MAGSSGGGQKTFAKVRRPSLVGGGRTQRHGARREEVRRRARRPGHGGGFGQRCPARSGRRSNRPIREARRRCSNANRPMCTNRRTRPRGKPGALAHQVAIGTAGLKPAVEEGQRGGDSRGHEKGGDRRGNQHDTKSFHNIASDRSARRVPNPSSSFVPQPLFYRCSPKSSPFLTRLCMRWGHLSPL